MTDLEIPYERDRKGHYRFFEILPGVLSWSLLLLPLILGFFSPTVAVLFVLLYLLVFFVRSLAYTSRALMGYRQMKQHLKLDWLGLVADLEAGEVTGKKIDRPKWHYNNLKWNKKRVGAHKPSQIVHAIIIATVNESREILEPTIQAVLNSDYDASKFILVIAYEGRAGKPAKDRVEELISVYGNKFRHAMAVEHPADLPGEIIGKGGNISHAGRALAKYVESAEIDPSDVLVTTLDADNRPDHRYFAAVSYLFCAVPDPIKAAFQPIAMFTNNIWDAPTMMRVIATGNNLFYIVGTQRQHTARNFSAHAQSLRALIDMDFWSVRTIVEDGHQFWRSYFHFDGDYRVYPLSIPIYQDAVLADGYMRTIKAQFTQLRRWTYGVSDIAYIADKGFWHPNKANKFDVIAKLLRSLEGHVTWATGTFLIYFAAFMPSIFHHQAGDLAAIQLPFIVARLSQFGTLFLLATIYVSLITLPPRPARIKRHHSIFMLTQWILLPITSICFGSAAAFNSQTRLIFKRYLSKFDVTEKASVSAEGKRSS